MQINLRSVGCDVGLCASNVCFDPHAASATVLPSVDRASSCNGEVALCATAHAAAEGWQAGASALWMGRHHRLCFALCKHKPRHGCCRILCTHACTSHPTATYSALLRLSVGVTNVPGAVACLDKDVVAYVSGHCVATCRCACVHGLGGNPWWQDAREGGRDWLGKRNGKALLTPPPSRHGCCSSGGGGGRSQNRADAESLLHEQQQLVQLEQRGSQPGLQRDSGSKGSAVDTHTHSRHPHLLLAHCPSSGVRYQVLGWRVTGGRWQVAAAVRRREQRTIGCGGLESHSATLE